MNGDESLRATIRRQRAELRRLNKYLGPYWAGFRRGMSIEAEHRLRGKMVAAFGRKQVFEAENCICSQAPEECPIHAPHGSA